MFFTTEDTVKVSEKFYRFSHVLQISIVKQCKSVFTEHLHAVLKAVNFL